MVRSRETNQNDAACLQDSLIAETTEEEQETLTTEESEEQLVSMVSFWVHVEENKTVIDMEIDEAISRLLTTKNQSAEFGAGEKDSADDDITVATTDSAKETIDFFTADSHLSDIRHFAESINLPEDDIKMLDKFKRRLQIHRVDTKSAKTVGEPTLRRFFAPK
jgi:hypothetical protein